MKRAWEIKELVDQKTKNSLLNRNIFRELKKEEKALFSECLKEAWKEAKRASELEKELKIKKEQSERLAKKKHSFLCKNAKMFQLLGISGTERKFREHTSKLLAGAIMLTLNGIIM